MSNSRKMFLLLTPSWFSFITGIALSAMVIGLTSLLIVQHSDNRLYESLQSIKELNVTFGSFWAAITSSIFDSTLLNKTLFIVFWMLLGFITYSILFTFKSSVDDSVTFYQQLHYVHARPAEMRRQVVVRLLLLGIAMAMWIIYGIVFTVALPHILSWVSVTLVDKHSPVNLIIAFLMFFVLTQIAVLLLRFTLLKPRMFGELEA